MKVNLLMANNLMFDYTGVVQTIEADFNNETETLHSEQLSLTRKDCCDMAKPETCK